MAREPQYPQDGSIGGASRPKAAVQAPAEASAQEQQAPESRRNKHLMAGAAIGIGSAAIVAALLYANRRGKGDKS
jgi:hypothetical protein